MFGSEVPYARAMEILLTAQPVSAEEALGMGFVNYVVPKVAFPLLATCGYMAILQLTMYLSSMPLLCSTRTHICTALLFSSSSIT